MNIELKQRGRAAIDFIADIGAWAVARGPQIDAAMQSRGLTPDALHEDRDHRLAQVDTAMADSPPFWAWARLGQWLAGEHGRVATAAFEEVRDELMPQIESLSRNSAATLRSNPNLTVPEYFDGVEFHLTEGGWDGHPNQGLIHGEIIHKRYVAKNYPGDIFAQRRAVLQELPRKDYARIFEMGTSSGHFTQAIAETFPDARLIGCDLSATMLRHAQCTANENRWAWELLQVPAEDTGLPDASFDLVTSFIVLHELPAAIVRAVFAEAYRLLEPGGDLLMSDVRRFADMNRLEEWRAHYLAVHGGEPYWEESATLDLADVAREVGFTEVKSYGLAPISYPWVTVARKPE